MSERFPTHQSDPLCFHVLRSYINMKYEIVKKLNISFVRMLREFIDDNQKKVSSC